MCVFCNIVNGSIPSYKIYEDDNFISFLDISQATIGHTLVVPKKHFETIFDLDEDTTKNIFTLVKKISCSLMKATNAKGLNILNNNGVTAGQSVNHFHIHLIPRYDNDNLLIKFNSNHLENNEFNDLLEKIKVNIH